MLKRFFSAADVPDVQLLIDKAISYKHSPFADNTLGKQKTIGLVFFNPSLRTRLSSQKAAQNLGMNVMLVNAGTESWKMEFEDGAIMNGTTVEHIKEGAAVLGEYCDIIAVRSFASLTDREQDYREEIILKTEQYSGRPLISLESATRHPLQSLADMMTIREIIKKANPRITLSWAPHPKALPQAVANSFLEWAQRYGAEITITHPPGYELSEEFTSGIRPEYNQQTAFENADIVYAKNWSSYENYGASLAHNENWIITKKKMDATNNASLLHCLPVRRNVEIADDALDNVNSRVIQQAGNRVWAAQAVIGDILTELGK
ncbi:acetylornithine carbamoyltransferase [Ignavibacteria bacterium]|nr:N-acetylornithine carbamoyltransferase [Bacteroidota bacterium]MCZ2133235.1 N-acetylornithine carbamoyltransferase [Bacteroidota bacterium]